MVTHVIGVDIAPPLGKTGVCVLDVHDVGTHPPLIATASDATRDRAARRNVDQLACGLAGRVDVVLLTNGAGKPAVDAWRSTVQQADPYAAVQCLHIPGDPGGTAVPYTRVPRLDLLGALTHELEAGRLRLTTGQAEAMRDWNPRGSNDRGSVWRIDPGDEIVLPLAAAVRRARQHVSIAHPAGISRRTLGRRVTTSYGPRVPR